MARRWRPCLLPPSARHAPSRAGSRLGPPAPTKAPRPRAVLYGSGLRLLECCRLRVPDLDFAMNQVVVRDGKGTKDRLTMLPALAKAAFARHLQTVKHQHEADLL